MSNDIINVSRYNITKKTINQNTKDKLGVTALLAIMEPVTESQSSRAYQQPLGFAPATKSKSYWTRVPMETFISYKKGKTNPFPT